MTIKIERLNQNNLEDWQNYVQNHNNSLLFHTIEWKKLMQDTYGYKPIYLLAYENNRIKGVLCSFLINSWLFGKKLTTAPFNFYNEPLFDSVEIGKALINKLFEIGKKNKVKYIEFKSRDELNKDLFGHHKLIEREVYERTVINIDSQDIMRSKLKKLAKRMIRRCEENYVKCEISEDPKDLKSFYKIMELLYCKKHKSIYQPFKLLKNYYKYLLPKKNVFLIKATHKGKFIGGSIMFAYKDVIFDQWSLSYTKEKISPNYYTIWNGLLIGNNMNKKVFDLGYTSPHDTGLVSFKSKWGGKTEKIKFYYLPIKSSNIPVIEYNESYKSVRELVRFIPIWMMRIMSNTLAKEFG